MKDWLYNPQFPPEWYQRPLYSLALWVNGLSFRNIQFSQTGMPVVKIAEIKNGISGQTKLTEQRFDESVLESRALAAQRDALLPKLVSGEVRVMDGRPKEHLR